MNEIQQEIPQAPEIETAVLGALLTDNNCIPENIDKIQIEFFINPVNQIIFSAIKEMYLLGKDVDILTLTIISKLLPPFFSSLPSPFNFIFFYFGCSILKFNPLIFIFSF